MSAVMTKVGGDVSAPEGPGAPGAVEALETERLEAEITSLAGHIAAATCRWLVLVAEFDRREAWAGWGCRSSAHWLAWQCAMGLRAAREHVRVARALAGLPAIRAAFAAGELSFSQARALTRVAEPGLEGELLALARHSTAAQLERLVGGYVKATALRDQARDAYERRQLVWWREDDGSVVINARLPAEDGALVLEALQAVAGRLRDRDRRPAPTTAPPAPPDRHPGGSVEPARHACGSAEPARDTDGCAEPARHADGCAEPARHAGGSAEPRRHAGGSAEPRRDTGGSAEPHRPPARALLADALTELARGAPDGPARGSGFEVVVNVDLETLATDARGTCRLACGTALAPETARRLGCDQPVVALHHSDGHPHSRGRKTRFASAQLNRVLDRRDQGCRFPGCTHTRHLHTHHIVHWAHGGPTSPNNLIRLCSHHHHLVHEGGYKISGNPATELVVRRPDGRRLPAHPSPRGGTTDAITELNRRHGVDPQPTTITPTWHGDSLDRDWAITTLANQS